MNKRKSSEGITLIALVITIIVLLIFAGVSIAMLTGNNGIYKKAQSAKKEIEKAKELELIELAILAAKVKGKGNITAESLTMQSGLTMECDIASIGERVINGVVYSSHSSWDINNLYYMGWDKTEELLYYVYGPFERQTVNYSLETNKMYHIKSIMKNGFQSIEVDGEVLKSTQISGNISINDKNLILFGGYDTNGLVLRPMRIGTTSIYNSSDVLIRNFIPCYTEKDVTDTTNTHYPKDTLGMYDTVNGKFYANSGNGELGFAKGDDV